MKTGQLNFAQSTALSWYNLMPERFDTATNNDWLLMYLERWLGIPQINNMDFIKQRMSKMPYETFRRAVQWLIEHGYIKLSEEHKRKRHRAEAETRETVLTNPHPMKTLRFMVDNVTGKRSEVWM